MFQAKHRLQTIQPTSLYAKNSNTSVILVPCLNCEELVQLENVDNHSRECLSVSMTVKAIGKSGSQFDEVHFKVNKFVLSLQKLITHNSVNKNKRQFLLRLYEIAQSVVQGEDKQVIDLEEELMVLQDMGNLSINMRQYTQRLLSLTKLKVQLIRNKFPNTQNIQEKTDITRSSGYSTNFNSRNRNSDSLIQRDSVGSSREGLKRIIEDRRWECSSIKSLAFEYQQKTLEKQHIHNQQQRITQIQSPGSQRSLINQSRVEQQFSQKQIQFDLLSAVSATSFQYDLCDSNQRNGNEFTEGQRQFYSKCLQQKMRLNQDDPAQQIPVSVLFKQSIVKNISQSQWDQFISSQLKQPELYLENSRSSRNSTGLKNSLKEKLNNQTFKQNLQQQV